VLGRVRAKFIRLSIDDTGVGYSSLKRIISLKPDMVKLERALVSNIDGDRIKQALIRALQEFAAEIGVRVVAEGVERAAERDALLNLGVTLGQGYLFGGAVSAALLREAIDRQ
jgi:EAL domain-containing protein (putative c-di-GMP-specific phosphodiesterase class I)